MANIGWHNVVLIVTELTAEEPKCHIFGICDCEYSRYDSSFVCPQNVHLTDHRDIDMMMLESPSVNKGLNAWNSKFPANIKKCVEPARHFGYLRIYNQLKGFNCDFKDKVKIAPVWDYGTHSLYEDWRLRIMTNFLDQTGDKGASEEDFNDFVEEKQLSGESWLDVCCGHDFLSLLGYMMVKEEYNSEDKIRPRMIELYSPEDFKTTKLYQSIKQWTDSKGVTVLLD